MRARSFRESPKPLPISLTLLILMLPACEGVRSDLQQPPRGSVTDEPNAPPPRTSRYDETAYLASLDDEMRAIALYQKMVSQINREGGEYLDNRGHRIRTLINGGNRHRMEYLPSGQLTTYTETDHDGNKEHFIDTDFNGVWDTYSVIRVSGRFEESSTYTDADNDGVFEVQRRLETDWDTRRRIRTNIRYIKNLETGAWNKFIDRTEEDLSRPHYSVETVSDGDINYDPAPSTLSARSPQHDTDCRSPWDSSTSHHRPGPPVSNGVVDPDATMPALGRIEIVLHATNPEIECTGEQAAAIRSQLLLMRQALDDTMVHFNKSRHVAVTEYIDIHPRPIYITCYGKCTDGRVADYVGQTQSNVYYGPRFNGGITADFIDLNIHKLGGIKAYETRITLAHELMHAIGMPNHEDSSDGVFDEIYSCERAIFCEGAGRFKRGTTQRQMHRSITRDAAVCAGDHFSEKILTNFDVRRSARHSNNCGEHPVCPDDQGEPHPEACMRQEYYSCEDLRVPLSAAEYGDVPTVYTQHYEVELFETGHPELSRGVCTNREPKPGLGGFGWKQPLVYDNRYPGVYYKHGVRFENPNGFKTLTAFRCERFPEYCARPKFYAPARWVVKDSEPNLMPSP